MYVRWVVRGHKNVQADVTFHDAYLVESYRNDEGEPRQRTLSYLGNIRQIGDTFPVIERELFLLRAELILDSLPGVSPADSSEVLKSLQQKVPPLDADEVRIGFLNTLRWYFRWWRENGGTPSDKELLRMIEIASDRPDASLDRLIS
ncbi:MAG: hypothetical protein GYB64_13220 [Chloroflexi bacterium]|nr:hypothetical protein [Chloroflexota bacterium]